MFEKAEGALDSMAGRVQEAYGNMTGDTGLQLKGKVRQAAGSVQSSYGDAVNQFRESAISNPIKTMAVIAGVSFITGVLWARRGTR